MLAVPFGGSRSVYSFFRVVRVVWWIACKCLAVMWSNFYDDFVTFSWEEDSLRTARSIELLFDLLVWQFAREGIKLLVSDQISALLVSTLTFRVLTGASLSFRTPTNENWS